MAFLAFFFRLQILIQACQSLDMSGFHSYFHFQFFLQVMQFGRIENGGYTLDFEAPFSPVQAFAIALASITQRLK